MKMTLAALAALIVFQAPAGADECVISSAIGGALGRDASEQFAAAEQFAVVNASKISGLATKRTDSFGSVSLEISFTNGPSPVTIFYGGPVAGGRAMSFAAEIERAMIACGHSR